MKYSLSLLLSIVLSVTIVKAQDVPTIDKAGKCYPTTQPIVSIPLPPINQRWVLNEQFSDEFNGETLDKNKWYDVHPDWMGREPGLFESKNVRVKDGCLELHGEKMSQPKVIHRNGHDYHFNISCAAVVSRTQQASYGYYECRMKANKTTLSSTFWMSSRGKDGTFPTLNNQPSVYPSGHFSQELDICETIGRGGDFQGDDFSKGMNCNVHYWYTPNGEKTADIRAKEVQIERKDHQGLSREFNIVGCWWVNNKMGKFYLNNKQEHTIQFRGALGQKYENQPFLFNKSMGINMVVEAYPQPWVELPTDEELSQSTLNTTYYDWVRVYKLVDKNKSCKIPDSTYKEMFNYQIHFQQRPQSLIAKHGEYTLDLAYSSPTDCHIVLEIYDSKNKKKASKCVQQYAGYAHGLYHIKAMLTPGENYRMVSYIIPRESTETNDAWEVDSFVFKNEIY